MQISPKLTKDFINQIAVPVSSNKALLIKALNTVRPTRPLWELCVNIIIILHYNTPGSYKKLRSFSICIAHQFMAIPPWSLEVVLEGARTTDSSRLFLQSRYFSSCHSAASKLIETLITNYIYIIGKIASALPRALFLFLPRRRGPGCGTCCCTAVRVPGREKSKAI